MKPQFNKILWRVNAVLAVVIVLVVCGYVLHVRSGHRKAEQIHTSDSDVRQTVTSYLAALADGDLGKLRELTCPGYHNSFFSKVDPEQYKAVHDNEAEAGDVFVLDSIDSVLLTPPTAQAQVTAHLQSSAQPQQLAFTLRQSDRQWQICEPEAPKTSSAVPR